MNTIFEEAKALQGDIITDRRWLHRHPEIGFDLPQTTGYVASRLREIGLEPHEIIRSGLVATIGDPTNKPCFLLRADMDALPMPEQSGLSFASENGFMHACGHDAHTAMLLGVARILKKRESELCGCIKLLFQPDEEGCAPDEICGNEAMIQAGALEHPTVDAAAAIHLMPLDFHVGELATRPQTCFSSIDDIDIVVYGRGGHGSLPHQLVDPFTVACHIYLGAQNLIARELSPYDQAVITFGSIQGGSAANVVPNEVHMLGTLRTINEETRSHMKERLHLLCNNLAQAFGAKARVQFLRGVPSVYNDPSLTHELIEYVEQVTGNEVTLLEHPFPGSDDMALISQAVPTTYFILGTGTQDEGACYPIHHPSVVFNEEVFAQGAATLASIALRWLANHS